MILDTLRESARYDGLGIRFAQAFAWLRSVDPASLPDGKTSIDGDKIYATVFRNATKPLEQVKWEAHRKYADIQFVFAGAESMLWEALSRTQTGWYDADKDFVALASETSSSFVVDAGKFAVFWPEDAHRPGIVCPGSGPVVKLVVKVQLAE
jgi:YhcH/YjgK/YiaL family protein